MSVCLYGKNHKNKVVFIDEWGLNENEGGKCCNIHYLNKAI